MHNPSSFSRNEKDEIAEEVLRVNTRMKTMVNHSAKKEKKVMIDSEEEIVGIPLPLHDR